MRSAVIITTTSYYSCFIFQPLALTRYNYYHLNYKLICSGLCRILTSRWRTQSSRIWSKMLVAHASRVWMRMIINTYSSTLAGCKLFWWITWKTSTLIFLNPFKFYELASDIWITLGINRSGETETCTKLLYWFDMKQFCFWWTIHSGLTRVG